VKFDLRALLLALVRVALGVSFAWAAATKIPNMQLFAEETANYRMLPAALVPLFSSMLVGVELMAGLLLIVGGMVRAAAGVTAAMLAMFIAAISQALLRGIDLRCGCFGGTEMASWDTVWRDVVMLAGAAIVLRFGGGRVLPQAPPEPAAD
jgi:uncharacterized membrane protein YphA (DoxX/SURF4 family)